MSRPPTSAAHLSAADAAPMPPPPPVRRTIGSHDLRKVFSNYRAPDFVLDRLGSVRNEWLPTGNVFPGQRFVASSRPPAPSANRDFSAIVH
jgi:hypothetical protein